MNVCEKNKKPEKKPETRPLENLKTPKPEKKPQLTPTGNPNHDYYAILFKICGLILALKFLIFCHILSDNIIY